ncbi:glycoside hydrolase family 30 beta sandwich domain-containing protein [Flavobacterium sp. LHD-80]|uniref:glycoside hydrolase family 30 protein n=1 Tax=Flavobacterium sp. LHD-80 TaxID=3071411 RepID=UPI0027DEB221|nr:glycoside hydrolase family 30 beta sandwich domain-containing protein [Flavobacterium sp. LHD-80]MDQ6470508.1 glycoside hydrolase family 30 beta sandwich domain-containing protein [Flavobacterium sp. LHD-80]
MKNSSKKLQILLLLPLIAVQIKCGSSKSTASNTGKAASWITTTDETSKLKKQPELVFNSDVNSNQTITVDASQKFQTIEGFGFSLTGGSAQTILKLDKAKREALLQELFSRKNDAVGISYLRISIGASDLNEVVFSYDDMPEGQTDLKLEHFNLGPDLKDVVPVLKEILAINPKIKIMGSPWSPPVWMKDNGSSKGGSLQPKYYQVYAEYFVKYIQAMKAQGIVIDAITPQNEPLHPGNNPSMLMLAEQQADFIGNNLGPAFKAAGIKTKIIVYDHNCNKPEYPLTILKNAKAYPFVTGSAFHLYEGDINALTTVHDAFPDKDLYFTEQYTGSKSSFENDLKWSVKNVVIGSMRNWSKNALSWGLANDENYKPFTPGGCSTCKGALMIDQNQNIKREVGYYIIGHASKFIPEGSVRIGSNIAGNLHNVAFKTPSGQIVLIVENDGTEAETFNIKYNQKQISTTLNAGAVATYVW